MADGAHSLEETGVIGMEDYRAATLRSLETLVVELLKREGDQAWLEGLLSTTEALPLEPTWVGLWRVSQQRILGKALGRDQQVLADDDIDEFDNLDAPEGAENEPLRDQRLGGPDRAKDRPDA